ncbi:MAG: SPOR domain-containing protein [Amphritea sp.]
MNDGFKQRMIGGALLLVAAVILIPVFFDGAGYKERHLESAIPPEPAIPVMVEIQPENPRLADTFQPAKPTTAVIIVPKPAPLAKAVAAQKPKIDLSKDTPVLDREGVPVAWSLQLASFKDADNAKGLRRKLIKADYKVYTRKNGDLIKVFVGPDMQKGRLTELQASIKKEFGLDGIIVRFTTR